MTIAAVFIDRETISGVVVTSKTLWHAVECVVKRRNDVLPVLGIVWVTEIRVEYSSTAVVVGVLGAVTRVVGTKNAVRINRDLDIRIRNRIGAVANRDVVTLDIAGSAGGGRHSAGTLNKAQTKSCCRGKRNGGGNKCFSKFHALDSWGLGIQMPSKKTRMCRYYRKCRPSRVAAGP